MNQSTAQERFFIVITGATAVGKSDLALAMADQWRGEIINADIGSFYTPLTIGTAKPAWQEAPVKHHLFDILDTPTDFNVASFYKAATACMEKLWAQGKTPIIVGGSAFYIKALYFPPLNTPNLAPQNTHHARPPAASLWDALQAIDPARAAELAPTDHYRLERALQIWEQTGKLPSLCKPTLAVP